MQDGRLFVIGNAEFPSLVDLVHHYENNYFYRKIKLLHPVTEQTVRHVAGLVKLEACDFQGTQKSINNYFGC